MSKTLSPETLSTLRERKASNEPSRTGLIIFGAGVALFLVGVVLFQELPLQVVLVIASTVLMFMGGSRMGKARKPGFDLMTWIAALWLIAIVSTAILAPVLPLGEHEDMSAAMMNPSMAGPNLLSAHPLGTNNFGLDIMARIIYGARVSLVVSLGAVAVGMILGGAIGIVAGFIRGPFDRISGILTNSLLSVPPLVLLIALATVLPPSLATMTLGLSLLALPSMVRMARASAMSFAQREFVTAARSMGANRIRIMVRELLPNVFLPMASYAMIILSVLIVAEASLSFLGLGIKPPEPSWGNLIAEGEGRVFQEHPHIVVMPGLALFFTVYSLNYLGEKARKRWDPRQGKI